MLEGEKRADIKVGFLCNNNCRFCVQAHKRHLGNKTTAQIKHDLEEARKTCSGVVFTGGEPTIRKDIFDLVRYATQLGFKTIQLQTNGRMFAYKNFCERMIEAGATEFGPALHGHVPSLHNFLTRSNSFKDTVKGIKNLHELKQQIIMNTVVVKPNYRFLPEIAKLFIKLKVNQFQFAFVHALGNALADFCHVVPKMTLAAPYIKQGLQLGISAGIPVMAEAMPYCMMNGYENYVSERFIPASEVRDIGYMIEDYKKIRIEQGKIKFPQCSECKYNNICEGPWKEYPEKYGNDEFKPVK